jgi:hypothetical protein
MGNLKITVSLALPYLGSWDWGRYNEFMQEHRHLPDSNRLSVLTAVILLAYALTRLIALPPFGIQASLLGVEMAFQISSSAVVSFLVAGLTATGMDWLLRSHPHLDNKNTLEHWILPALTAWIIGISIFSLSESALWWLAFLLGGVFLVLICVAEYVAVDPDDSRYGVAVASLTGLSFVLLLVLITALRAVGMRLIVFLPPLFLAVWLVSMRTLHLRLGGRWEFYWSLGIAFVVAQLAAPLHYWQISPLQFGLLLLGPAYALTSLAANLNEAQPFRRAMTEPLVALAIVWSLSWVG